MFRLLVLSALAFLAQLGISWPLWTGQGRTFPLTPLLPLGEFPIFWLFLPLLLLSPWLWQKRPAYLYAPLALLTLLCVQDLQRLQVWVYFYAWIWFVAAQGDQLQPLRLLLVAMYVWTGIFKLNEQFCNEVFTWWMGIYELTKPLKAYPSWGYSVGLLEIVLGLGLLWRPAKKIATVGLIAMHLSILAFLIKDNWNQVVYPWNILLVSILPLLFWSEEGQEEPTPPLLRGAMMGLLLIGPMAYPLGVYPYNLSFTMYSGLAPEFYLILDDEGLGDCGFGHLEKDWEYESDTQTRILMDDWSIREMQVPSMASGWSFRAWEARLCPCLRRYNGRIEWHYPHWRDAKEDTIRRVCR
jgi:hypothetical protein